MLRGAGRRWVQGPVSTCRPQSPPVGSRPLDAEIFQARAISSEAMHWADAATTPTSGIDNDDDDDNDYDDNDDNDK